MSEEYKKLSELPQAVNPGRCEAYGIESGKSVRVPLAFATPTEVNTVQNAVNTAKDDILIIQNSVVKSCVSENEALNDVVKELYFDRWCNANQISTIQFKRNGLAGSNIVWELYLVDKNGTSHWVSFGQKAEQQDVNVAKVGWSENTTSALFSESNRNKVTCYAVIDWSKLTDQQGENKSDTIATPKIKLNVNYNKYFPQINTCITTHKYVHDVEANSVIKELYFENLTRNGVAITDYEFRNEFSLVRIDKGAPDSKGNPMWSLVFTVKNDNDDGHFFIYTERNPEASIVWSKAASYTIGGVVYSGTVYAVIDWTKILYGNMLSFSQPLLNGCLKLSNSPIICNYIELNKMRQELGLRPINEE